MRRCLILRQGASPLRPRPPFPFNPCSRTEGICKGYASRAKIRRALDRFPPFRTRPGIRERGPTGKNARRRPRNQAPPPIVFTKQSVTHVPGLNCHLSSRLNTSAPCDTTAGRHKRAEPARANDPGYRRVPPTTNSRGCLPGRLRCADSPALRVPAVSGHTLAASGNRDLRCSLRLRPRLADVSHVRLRRHRRLAEQPVQIGA
jgi:hypothetical protein